VLFAITNLIWTFITKSAIFFLMTKETSVGQHISEIHRSGNYFKNFSGIFMFLFRVIGDLFTPTS